MICFGLWINFEDKICTLRKDVVFRGQKLLGLGPHKTTCSGVCEYDIDLLPHLSWRALQRVRLVIML